MSLGTVVMLAGAIRPTTLATSLGIHPLELPLRSQETLLCTWLDVLHDSGADKVRIAVNDSTGASRVQRAMSRSGISNVEIVIEKASWRGSAGLVRDLTEDLNADEVVTVVEGASLPPESLESLVRAMTPMTAAVIGATDSYEPMGMYLFRRDVFRSIPRVGYHDMKEQLLPAINAQRGVAKLAILGTEVCRIRDRRSYLRAVELVSQRREESNHTIYRRADGARVVGASLVSDSAHIESRALIQDSVILDGSVVGQGAVVCRSIIGPGAKVPEGTRMIDSVLTERPHTAGDSRSRLERLTTPN